MDTPHGRTTIPAPSRRLHGGDRSGLGQDGWAEVDADAIGHPDETNIAPDFHEPMRGGADAESDD